MYVCEPASTISEFSPHRNHSVSFIFTCKSSCSSTILRTRGSSVAARSLDRTTTIAWNDSRVFTRNRTHDHTSLVRGQKAWKRKASLVRIDEERLERDFHKSRLTDLFRFCFQHSYKCCRYLGSRTSTRNEAREKVKPDSLVHVVERVTRPRARWRPTSSTIAANRPASSVLIVASWARKSSTSRITYGTSTHPSRSSVTRCFRTILLATRRMTRVDVLAAVSRNDVDASVVDERYLCALLLRKRNGLPSNRSNGIEKIATFKSPNRPGSVRDVETTRSDLVSFVESLIVKNR